MAKNSASPKRRRGRPASFNRQELVAQVIELFWEKGYHNTSFNEIASRTGLTRASLYNSFESKEALFEEALNQYFELAPSVVLRSVQKNDLVGPALYRMFKIMSVHYVEEGQRRGCLVVNGINELANEDTQVGELIRAAFDKQRQMMFGLIQQAVQLGELPADTDLETTTNLLITFISGICTFAKGNANSETLEKIGVQFLRQLGFQQDSSSSLSSV